MMTCFLDKFYLFFGMEYLSCAYTIFFTSVSATIKSSKSAVTKDVRVRELYPMMYEQWIGQKVIVRLFFEF